MFRNSRKSDKSDPLVVPEITMEISDITEEFCQSCGYCCLTQVPVVVDERVLDYYTAIGVELHDDGAGGYLVNLGPCQHLIEEGSCFRCGIYPTRPQLCKDYNCVAWHKVANVTTGVIMDHVKSIKRRRYLNPDSGGEVHES